MKTRRLYLIREIRQTYAVAIVIVVVVVVVVILSYILSTLWNNEYGPSYLWFHYESMNGGSYRKLYKSDDNKGSSGGNCGRSGCQVVVVGTGWEINTSEHERS